MKSRKGNDRRQSTRSISKDRRLDMPEVEGVSAEEVYRVSPEYADEIEIIEDKSLGEAQPISTILEDRERDAFEKGQINYTPFQANESHSFAQGSKSTTHPLDIEKLKNQLRTEILAEIQPEESIEINFEKGQYKSDYSDTEAHVALDVHPTEEEQQIPIKPFQKKRRPGRPSSLPKESQSNEWPRKTYRFHKQTLKKLKMYQARLDEHQDLSIIINEALSDWLGERL